MELQLAGRRHDAAVAAAAALVEADGGRRGRPASHAADGR